LCDALKRIARVAERLVLDGRAGARSKRCRLATEGKDKANFERRRHSTV
jgi:hypothetical protein